MAKEDASAHKFGAGRCKCPCPLPLPPSHFSDLPFCVCFFAFGAFSEQKYDRGSVGEGGEEEAGVRGVGAVAQRLGVVGNQ